MLRLFSAAFVVAVKAELPRTLADADLFDFDFDALASHLGVSLEVRTGILRCGFSFCILRF